MVVTTHYEGKRDVRDATIASVTFAMSNFTENVAINCDSASNDQLADCLATLIGQLMEAGIIQGTVISGSP